MTFATRRLPLYGWLAAALLALMLAPERAPAQDRHYMWVFSSQSTPKRPKYTHTWAVFARVSELDGQTSFEAFAISWMPATLNIRGYAIRPETGVNLDLPTTLRLVNSQDQRISLWGPFAISPVLFDRAVAQKARLEDGEVEYRMVDPLVRNLYISDCIHAVSDIAGQSRLSYVEAVFFGEAAGRRIAHGFQRLGMACPVQEDLRWIEQALGMDCYPIVRRK